MAAVSRKETYIITDEKQKIPLAWIGRPTAIFVFFLSFYVPLVFFRM
jgi:hypothetical protein